MWQAFALMLPLFQKMHKEAKGQIVESDLEQTYSSALHIISAAYVQYYTRVQVLNFPSENTVRMLLSSSLHKEFSFITLG